MGTRSLIIMRVLSKGKMRVWCVLYQQYDGYLSGVGLKLVDFLSKIILVNGIPLGDSRKLANGPGDLFAQIITLFKRDVGGTYLMDPNDITEEEYNYYVTVDEDNIPLGRISDQLKEGKGINVLIHHGTIIFEGTPESAKEFIKDQEDLEDSDE